MKKMKYDGLYGRRCAYAYICKRFSKEYDDLYDGRKAEDYTKVDLFDKYMKEDVRFKNIVSDFCEYRNDILSSDREINAFMNILDDLRSDEYKRLSYAYALDNCLVNAYNHFCDDNGIPALYKINRMRAEDINKLFADPYDALTSINPDRFNICDDYCVYRMDDDGVRSYVSFCYFEEIHTIDENHILNAEYNGYEVWE